MLSVHLARWTLSGIADAPAERAHPWRAVTRLFPATGRAASRSNARRPGLHLAVHSGPVETGDRRDERRHGCACALGGSRRGDERTRRLRAHQPRSGCPRGALRVRWEARSRSPGLPPSTIGAASGSLLARIARPVPLQRAVRRIPTTFGNPRLFLLIDVSARLSGRPSRPETRLRMTGNGIKNAPISCVKRENFGADPDFVSKMETVSSAAPVTKKLQHCQGIDTLSTWLAEFSTQFGGTWCKIQKKNADRQVLRPIQPSGLWFLR